MGRPRFRDALTFGERGEVGRGRGGDYATGTPACCSPRGGEVPLYRPFSDRYNLSNLLAAAVRIAETRGRPKEAIAGKLRKQPAGARRMEQVVEASHSQSSSTTLTRRSPSTPPCARRGRSRRRKVRRGLRLRRRPRPGQTSLDGNMDGRDGPIS